MRLFGSQEELSKIVFRNNTRKLTVQPSTQTTGDGIVNVPDLAGTTHSLVLAALAQVLTNKTIDASSNTISNLTNSNISASAAIAYSKLALTNSIVNGDISSSAAVSYSKLALSNSILNADINASASIAYSKLNLASSIVNADIASGAAIARSKLASGSANHVIINDGTGVLSSEAQLAGTRGGTGVSSTAVYPTSGDIITRTSSDLSANRIQNKHLDSSTIAFVDTTDTTKRLYFNTANNPTSVQTTLFTNNSSNALITLPSASSTLATLALSENLTNKTLTSPSIEGTGATFKDNSSVILNNSANTFSTSLKAVTALAASYTLTLPSSAGTSGQVLTTAGASGLLSWTSPLVNPMDSEGDLIVGSTGGAAVKFDHPGAADYLINSTSSTGLSWSRNPSAQGYLSKMAIDASFTVPTGYTWHTGKNTVNSSMTVTVSTSASWAVLDSLIVEGDIVCDGDIIIY